MINVQSHKYILGGLRRGYWYHYCIARIGSYRILVGLGDVYVSPDPETRYDMA